jgi:cationic amino acid transporter 4
MACKDFVGKLQRKKTLPADIMQTSLKRCLNSFDLTLFGIGHMVGGGIYVLTGTVAHSVAGPGVVFSYVIAGIVSVLVALCYAEFGSKIPKTGSAYMYTYVMLGEVWAFFVGWNLVLEQAIGAASVARAWSGAVNVAAGGAVSNGTMRLIGTINVPYLSPYPDFLAVGLLIVLMVVVATGVRINAIINNVLTVVNVCFLSFIIVTAFVFAQPDYWMHPGDGDKVTGMPNRSAIVGAGAGEGQQQGEERVVDGGPLPFGFTGVMAGSAMCFFAYTGFECVTQAAEEATNPAKAVPIGILATMGVVTFLYVSASLSLTLLVPYFSLDVTAPFAQAFADRGVKWMMYVSSVGTIVATTTTTMASLYSLSRLVYALAEDKLFFSVFARINSWTKTPLIATLVFSIIAMIAAAVTDINELAEMLSAGALMAFSFLAIDVLVLRYQTVGQCPLPLRTDAALLVEVGPGGEFHNSEDIPFTITPDLRQPIGFNLPPSPAAVKLGNVGRLKPRFARWRFLQYVTSRLRYPLPLVAISVMCTSSFLFLLVLLRATDFVVAVAWWAIILLIMFGSIAILAFIVLLMHDYNTALTSFQVQLHTA